MSEQKNDIPNPGDEKKITRHRSHRSKKLSKSKKKISFKRFRKWTKRNPSKAIAVFSIAVIIAITVSFYFYNLELIPGDIRPNEKRSNKKNPIKGILLPVTLITESSSLIIKFGTIAKSLSLKQLRRGYTISPQNLINCAIQKRGEDRTKFTILLVEDRLYVNATFTNLSNNEVVAATDRKHFTISPKNLSRFYSDDNSFKVYDAQGNINFNVEFNAPDSLFIQGYFIGEDCIYVIGRNTTFSDSKVGNYTERAIPEIKQLSNYVAEQ